MNFWTVKKRTSLKVALRLLNTFGKSVWILKGIMLKNNATGLPKFISFNTRLTTYQSAPCRRRRCFFQCFQKPSSLTLLPDMPILGFQIQQEIQIWCQKYGQMGIQLSNWVENIVEKGRNCLLLRYIGYFFFFFGRRIGSKINVGKGEIAFF